MFLNLTKTLLFLSFFFHRTSGLKVMQNQITSMTPEEFMKLPEPKRISIFEAMAEGPEKKAIQAAMMSQFSEHMNLKDITGAPSQTQTAAAASASATKAAAPSGGSDAGSPAAPNDEDPDPEEDSNEYGSNEAGLDEKDGSNEAGLDEDTDETDPPVVQAPAYKEENKKVVDTEAALDEATTRITDSLVELGTEKESIVGDAGIMVEMDTFGTLPTMKDKEDAAPGIKQKMGAATIKLSQIMGNMGETLAEMQVAVDGIPQLLAHRSAEKSSSLVQKKRDTSQHSAKNSMTRVGSSERDEMREKFDKVIELDESLNQQLLMIKQLMGRNVVDPLLVKRKTDEFLSTIQHVGQKMGALRHALEDKLKLYSLLLKYINPDICSGNVPTPEDFLAQTEPQQSKTMQRLCQAEKDQLMMDIMHLQGHAQGVTDPNM